MNNKITLVQVLIIGLFSIVLLACSTTHQSRSVQKSGFLGDYSQLKAGESDQALLRYVHPSAQWSMYNKVIIDPVSFYASKDSKLSKASYEERQALADYFTAAIHIELAKDYKIVATPAPDVMRIKVAITDADSSKVMMNTVSTILPVGLALSSLKRVVTGSDSFVGEAQCEIDIRDSFTERRLAAAVDKRIGTKALRSKFGGWNDAKESFDFWAAQLRTQMGAARAGKLTN